MARKKKKQGSGTPTIENRRARYDYEIGETLEVGVVLTGSEVKSVRDGKVSLQEGYVRVNARVPRLVLVGVNIAEYQPAGPANHTPVHDRILLAHTREIEKLARAIEQKGSTIVPLKMFFNDDGRIKLKIGVGVGRGQSDKRRAIGEREARRDMERAMSRGRIGR